jgi:hypothetical protein
MKKLIVSFKVLCCVIIAVSLSAVVINAQATDRSKIYKSETAENMPKTRIAYSKARLDVSIKEKFSPNGSFVVFIFRKGRWERAGELYADRHYRNMKLDMKRLARGKITRLRLEQNGGGAAHIDSLFLAGSPPVKAPDDLMFKISRTDYDVIDASNKSYEFEFDTGSSPWKKPPALELYARIEPEEIKEIPFQYPLDNMFKTMSETSAYYSYRAGENPGKLTLDGELSEENLGTPFFSEYYPVGSGHPQGATYGWVCDDGNYLYVALDVTGDNTSDGGKDYTKVYVNTPSGIRVFKVTARETRWGRPGFSYTDRVIWQHKVYEYAIPFEELGASARSGEPLLLAFAAYGTLAPTEINKVNATGVDPDTGPSGTTFTFTVNYMHGGNQAPEAAQLWIDLDGDGEYTAGVIPGTFPKIPLLGMVVMLAGMIFTVFYVSRRKPRLRLVIPSLAAVLLLLFFAGLTVTGCEYLFPTEIYDMARISTAAPDYTVGEDYTVDVTIDGDPRTVIFRFYFVDPSGSTEIIDGNAVGDLTVTITSDLV